MSGFGFGDGIQANLDLITELMTGVPPSVRGRVKRAAVTIENAITGLQRDNPRDPATALGIAFAVYTIAQRLVEKGAETDKSLIQLLS